MPIRGFVFLTFLLMLSFDATQYSKRSPYLQPNKPGSRRTSIDGAFLFSTQVNYKHLMVEVSCRGDDGNCPLWEWDVANWTLKYVDPNQTSAKSLRLAQGSTCYRPLHGERVLKIIHPNGQEEFRECTPSATACKYHPHFDKELGLRINSSPCCRKQLIQVIKHVATVLEEHNITYMLIDGTLLGFVRDHGKLIPYDHDVDVIVDAREAAKVDRLVSELEGPGYVFEYVPNFARTWFRVNFNAKLGSPGVDLWFFYIVGGNVVANYGNWGWVQAREDVLPPRKGTFEGREFWFPNEPVKVLDRAYGKDKWRDVLSCTKLDENSNCVE